MAEQRKKLRLGELLWPGVDRPSVFTFDLVLGLDWAPGTGTLWTVVNERDGLGDDLVPDYATSLKDGGFYGWPWSYFGSNVDERVKPQRPDLVQKAIVPDFALGAHWQPSDTKTSGSLHWLKRGKSLDDQWQLFPIDVEPTIHRIRFADINGDGAGLA